MKKLIRYVSQSVQRKLLLSVLGVTVLQILLVAISFYYIQMRSVSDLTYSSMQTEVSMAFSDLEDTFQDAVNICESIENSVIFQACMRKTYPSKEELYSTELDINMELMAMTVQAKNIDGVYVIGNNGVVGRSSFYSLKNLDFTQSAWFKKTSTLRNPVWYGVHDGSYLARTNEKRTIACCYPFRDKASNRNVGVIVVEITEDTINKKLNQNLVGNGAFLLLDQRNKIFYRSQTTDLTDADLEKTANEARNNFTALILNLNTPILLSNRDLYIVATRSHTTEWTLVGTVARDFYWEDIQIFVYAFMGMLMVCALLSYSITKRITYRFTNPIIEIEDAMKAVEEGDLSVRADVRGNDEIAGLAQGFNEMVEQVNELMNSIYEDQSRMRRLELRALQEQIKPHFLYNSLDSIKWLLRLKRNDDAIAMVKNLTALLRISLSHGREIITVEDELKHVTAYLELQKMEYRSKFDYRVVADERVTGLLTPKLLLQPLVENALNHGISREKREIHIVVRALFKEKDLLFQVEDDGIGIEDERLKALQERLSTTEIHMEEQKKRVENSDMGGYGLQNVNDRIRLNYGAEYGMEVHSEKNRGTIVSIRIPKNI